MENAHDIKVKSISYSIIRLINQREPVYFYHGSTNSTRTQENKNSRKVDISNLDEIIEINTEDKYILVEPNVPMDKLLNATLENNLLPLVIPEFPGITVGGAVSGASLESSSWKYGQFNDCCFEYEIILGNGKIIKASEVENPDLFFAVSGAYGTLGLITLVKIRLQEAKPYVHLKYIPASTPQVVEELTKQIKNSNFDYIESLIFDKDISVIIIGNLISEKNSIGVQTFSKRKDPWFYEYAKGNNINFHEILVPIRDYIFRYNRGAFWMGEYFFSLLHLPNTKFVKWFFNPFMNTRKLYDGLKAFNLGQHYYLQDFYCPVEKSMELISFTEKELSIYPIWLCPVKVCSNDQKLSPHYIKNSEILSDIGIWGRTEKYDKPIEINKNFEKYVKQLNGRKMLYAHAYYDQKEFWDIYDKKWYATLRNKYNAEGVFPGIWQKVHVSTTSYKLKITRGVYTMFRDWIKGKNLNS